MRTVSEPKDGPTNGLESADSPQWSGSGGASDGEPGGGGGFGVSVCLRRVLGAADPRARCLVWVEPGRRARCLLRRLRRLCGPRAPVGELGLLVRGHWLPPDEPLALLRPGDQLQLIPIEESQPAEETGAGRAARGAGRGDGGEGGAELERGKKRALGLLERYEAGAGAVSGAGAGAGESPPPAARRRRRHRRAAPRRELTAPPAPSPPPGDPAPAPAPGEPRAPRVVRAMSLSPPPPPPAPAAAAESPEALE